MPKVLEITNKGYPVYEVQCPNCHQKFGVVHTPVLEGRLVGCPKCTQYFTITSEAGRLILTTR